MPELNRRGFIAAAVSACALCALGGDVLAADKKTEPVDVGPVAGFKADGIFDTDARKRGFFLVRNQGKLYAASSICTHKGAALTLKNGEMFCPKHNSHFSVEGTVIKGPAKSTLERYAISVDVNGHVIVDPSKSFREKDFDDKASFVAIKT